MNGHMPLDHEPTLQDALSTLARQAIRISQLEADNVALRTQLDARLRSGGSIGPDANSESAITSRIDIQKGASNERYAAICTQYEDLKAAYSQLEFAHSECGPTIEKYQQKLKDAKQRCKEWKVWREKKKQQGKLQEDDRPRSTSRINSEMDSRADLPFTAGTQVPKEPRITTAVADVSSDLPSSPPKSSSIRGPPRIMSSQTTVVEETAEQAGPLGGRQDAGTNDSDPVLVSARPVKRNAAASMAEPPARRVKIKQEPNSPDTALDLISEDYSSPKRTPQRLPRMETTDLDNTGPTMLTPRRRHLTHQRTRATSEEVSRPAPRLLRAASSYSDGGLSSDTVGLSDFKSKTHARDTEIDSGFSKDVVDGSRQRSTDLSHEDVLRPLSINVPTKSRASHKSRRRTSRTGHLALLSEAGDEEASQVTPHLHGAQVNANHRVTNDDRLDDLLNERSPEKTPTFVREPSTATRTKIKAPLAPTVPTPASAMKQLSDAATSKFGGEPPQNLTTPVSAVKRVSPIKSKSPVKHFNHQDGSPPPIDPEHEPLRIRGLDRLGLDDFKINTKYLGTDFAFADTLRGRDQRRNLQASKKPELDKAIAMGGGPALSGKTDAQALLTFLGRNWEDLLGGYGAVQRKDIVAQAHIHSFTTQYGKQRQAFQRRSTPPGFWETDFPTTQEVAQNRAKALELERQEVAERWREAMRENGRWVFRDE